MITQEQIPTVLEHPVQDIDGNKIGDAKHVFLDDVTGRPEWVSVKTGLFGTRESFVPTREATMVEDHLEVPYTADTVEDAPNVDVDAGGHLSEEEEHRLYEHYGIAWDEAWQQANQPGQGGWAHTGSQATTDATTTGTALAYDDTTASGIARSGKEHVDPTAQPNYDDASGIARSGDDEAMTRRSQEKLRVGTERRHAGRARLIQYMVADEQRQSVPPRHEEFRVEHEPISSTTGEQALTGPEIPDAQHEVPPHEERIETESVDEDDGPRR
ncbi:DUF2382 domain-containing protein [Streptomyces sp. NPDC002889]|uniref:DUF2382 domain-containing protein n=1 Tax=Streptomyces sp. NPDC002889 TaxID=3364669 RepID=UPI0036C01F7E